MGGVFAGHSRQPKNGNDRTGATPVTVPTMPKLAGCWQELDAAEVRRLQLWGQRIIDDIRQWRHREQRRREGRGVSA
jgi:hypothetical protein